MNKEANEVFLDPNFIYYLVERGEAFEHVLECLKQKYKLCTDVKALQEIVYRNQLLGDTGKGYSRAMDLRHKSEVHPIGPAELEKLEGLMDLYPRHLPRELLHVAVMMNQGVKQIICAPDSTYHEVEEVQALHPVAEICSRY